MTFDAHAALEQFLRIFESGTPTADLSQQELAPRQAISMLRVQGRLSQSGPLPLFASLFVHLGDDGTAEFDSTRWTVRWPNSLGPLEESVALALGIEALAVQGVEVGLDRSCVAFSSAKGEVPLAQVFEPFWERLAHFPWSENGRPKALDFLPETLCSTEIEGRRLDFTHAPSYDPFGVLTQPSGRFVQVVQGIAYPRKWSLPVDAVLHDLEGRPDYSHIIIPDTDRRDRLMADAAEQFRRLLPEMQRPEQPLLLESKRATGELAVGDLVRNQAARERWLATHPPGEPGEPSQPYFQEDEHRVSRAAHPQESSLVHFRREGRPFGSFTLDPEACRPGFVIVWVENELPPNLFWNGPELSAVLARFPQLDQLCEKAEAALA